MDIEKEFLHHFFQGKNLQSTIVSLCKNVTGTTLHIHDPISHNISIMLNTPWEIQLVANGLQPFHGKDLMIPYHCMNTEQREFLLHIMSMTDQWNKYEHSLVFKHRKPRQSPPHTGKLDTLDVLEALCQLIQNSQKYPDDKSKLAINNIILQRIHSSVPLSGPIQVALNKRLFAKK
jgi:hypothetical protein